MNKNYIIKRQFFIIDNHNQIQNKFTFVKEIGKGAFGTVYLAHQKIFPYKIRAIKAIQKQRVKNPTIIYNQIKILGQMDHPNIIKLYQTFEDQQHLYLVCESIFNQLSICTGNQLYHRLAHYDTFDEKRAKNLFQQMSIMINYLHIHHVCHRDLKLENFLLENQSSWQLKLIDFGQSYIWKNDMRIELKNEKKLVGTTYYMSPEVLSYSYNEKCDIWSLGVILYMMVTGFPPFAGQTQKEIMKNILDYSYSLKKQECSKLSPQLLDLISRIFKPESQRISLIDILNHPWIKMKEQTHSIPLKIAFQQLNIYSTFSKMKKIVSSQMATHMSSNEIKKLKKMFLRIDEDNDGYLSIDQLYKHCKSNGHESMGLEELQKMMKELDSDQNGKINYNEFISSCIDESIILNLEYLQYCFKSFDLNSDGKIQRQQFNTILKVYTSQYSCNDQLAGQLIEENDQNKDGELDFTEFLSSMKQIDVSQSQLSNKNWKQH